MHVDEPQTVGRFVLDRPLGRGGMGSVWRARHRDGGAPVAIKLIHAGRMTRTTAEALRAESEAVARLDHPHGHVEEAQRRHRRAGQARRDQPVWAPL